MSEKEERYAEMFAELERYREREPLVQKLIDAIDDDEDFDCDWQEVVTAAAAVAALKVTP